MSYRALAPGRIGGLVLRNRFIKTATFEGMTPEGRVTDQLIDHHAEMARNQVALTTVAYAAVHADGRTFEDQLLLDDANAAGLARLAAAVHAQGGKVSVQLGHCGGFSRNQSITGGRPMGPSAGWNTYGLLLGVPRVRAMTDQDLEAVPRQYAAAAALVRDAGFDAVEIHCGHGYLLSQFLSPAINRRRDDWGGDLAGRLRLPLAVVAAVRGAVGPDFPILAKLNTRDDVPGGLELPDAVRIGHALVDAGADCLVPSGGLVNKSPWYLMRGGVPLRAMIKAERQWAQRWALRLFGPMVMKRYAYRPNFFFDEARALLDAVDAPVALLGGVDSAAAVRQAMEAGFEFVALGRALLADPGFIPRLAAGEAVVSRCNHCNACVAEMDAGGVRCVLDG